MMLASALPGPDHLQQQSYNGVLVTQQLLVCAKGALVLMQ
jgi:hypothetical protein